MDSYKEYSIRCKTCNGLIAAHSGIYESLLQSGLSIEEALNNIGLTNWCCRINMMNPTIVTFNMENRDIIEGYRAVEAVDIPNPYTINLSPPIFNSCLGNVIVQKSVIPTTSTTNIFPGHDLSKMGPGIDVTSISTTTDESFQTPVSVGIPTINPDQTRPRNIIDVGVGKKVVVLNGRSCLAR